MSGARRWWLPILLVALILRFWSLDFGLPDWMARPDEANITSRVMRMLMAGDYSPNFFEYPALWLYLLRTLFAGMLQLGLWLDWWSNAEEFMGAYLRDPGAWLLTARVAAALCGVATVALMAPWARRLGGSGWLAALILAVVPLHVRDSHFGTTDVPATFLVLLALIWAERLRRGGGGRELLWAGVWVGLAGATKYNLALVGVAPALAILLVPGSRPLTKAARLGLVALTALALFFLVNPYVILDYPRFREDFGFQTQHMLDGHGWDLGAGWIYHLRESLRHGLTWPLLGAALGGLVMVLAAPRRWRAALPALAFALLYYLVMGRSLAVFYRYMIPILPVLACSADLALTRLGSRLPRGRSLVLGGALGLCCLAALKSARINWIMGQEDTRAQAAAWLLDHLGPEDGLVLAGGHGYIYGEPRLPGREWCQILSIEIDPQNCPDESPFPTLRVVDARAGLAGVPRQDFPWILTHDHTLKRYSAVHFKLAAELERVAEPVAEFAPGSADQGGVFDPIDAFYVPMAGFRGIERPGPRIRIWRFRDPAADRG